MEEPIIIDTQLHSDEAYDLFIALDMGDKERHNAMYHLEPLNRWAENSKAYLGNKIESAKTTSRTIERKLRDVEELPESESIKMIGEVE